MPLSQLQDLGTLPDLSLSIARDSTQRTEVLSFIQERFAAHFDAQVGDDTATLVGGYDGAGQLVAAFGLRTATDEFFCEHYLDQPLPGALSREFGVPLAIDSIVEVVHLCANRPGFLVQLVPVLAGTLAGHGFRYLACTATGCLTRFFTRRGLPVVMLNTADPQRLPQNEVDAWGRYYESKPRVIAGDLSIVCSQLNAR